MRELALLTPVDSGLHDVDGVTLDLTEADARDLNEGSSVTTLTAEGFEVAVFPAEAA